MNIEIIKSKFPLAFAKVKVWSKYQIIKQGIAKEIVNNFTDETIEQFLPAIIASRALYDFFDDYNIHMFPMGSIEWQFKVVDPANHNNFANEEKYPTRILAEDAGFSLCFSELENKLK